MKHTTEWLLFLRRGDKELISWTSIGLAINCLLISQNILLMHQYFQHFLQQKMLLVEHKIKMWGGGAYFRDHLCYHQLWFIQDFNDKSPYSRFSNFTTRSYFTHLGLQLRQRAVDGHHHHLHHLMKETDDV